MGGVAHPRGRLPARVYWFRRALVLATALALVFAIGRLLTPSGSPALDGAARVTAGSPTPTPAPTLGVAGPQPVGAGTGNAAQPSATGTPIVLAAPNGPCAVDDITVTPTVPQAVAGGRVDLVLQLTGIRPACTFAVTSHTLVARISSGKDRVWSTQDCPKAVKSASVVVRSATPTEVVVSWSGRRSDDGCSRATPWALPGYYHLTAAAIGSEPGDAQFQLTSPPRPVVTKTAHPKKKHHKHAVVDSGRRDG